MTIPPEYAQYHKELQDAIDHPQKLSDTVLANAADAMTANAGTSGSESKLLEEIGKMSGAAVSVDNSFSAVARLFLDVRNGMSAPDVKADMRKLEDRWVVHHQTYKDLLWKSRTVAGKAQAASDDFSRDFVLFLGDDNESIETKKREITLYLKELDRDGKAAEEMSQGFVDLQKNIINLVDDWKGLVKKYNIDALSARVEQLKKDMDDLAVPSQSNLERKIAELTAAFLISFGFSGVLAVLVVSVPAFTLGLVTSSLSPFQLLIDLQKAQKEQDEVTGKYISKIFEYISVLPSLLQVQELQGALKKADSDINNICDKIGGFAKVWAMIRTDLQAVSEKLDYVIGTESERLFKSRLNSTAKLYALLGKALYQYQIIVTADHPVFATMNRT